MFTLPGYFVPLLTFVFQRDTPKQDLLSCKCGFGFEFAQENVISFHLKMLDTYLS